MHLSVFLRFLLEKCPLVKVFFEGRRRETLVGLGFFEAQLLQIRLFDAPQIQICTDKIEEN